MNRLIAYEKIITYMRLRNTNIVQGMKIIDGFHENNTRKYKKINKHERKHLGRC